MMPTLFPYYAALLSGIALGVMGQILLKTGAESSRDMAAQFLSPFTLLGLGCYGLASVLYIVAIRKIPLSLAYPTVSISYVVVALVAHLVWGETLGFAQIAGIVLIMGGIVLLHQA